MHDDLPREWCRWKLSEMSVADTVDVIQDLDVDGNVVYRTNPVYLNGEVQL